MQVLRSHFNLPLPNQGGANVILNQVVRLQDGRLLGWGCTAILDVENLAIEGLTSSEREGYFYKIRVLVADMYSYPELSIARDLSSAPWIGQVSPAAIEGHRTAAGFWPTISPLARSDDDRGKNERNDDIEK